MTENPRKSVRVTDLSAEA